jgi:hypothetical protein
VVAGRVRRAGGSDWSPPAEVTRADFHYHPTGVPMLQGTRSDPVRDGAYALDRYHVHEAKTWNVRYHQIRTPDPADFHDHPWDYVTTLVAGAYLELTPGGSTLYRAPVTLIRRAEDLHRLELPEGPVWTLLVTGPVRRRWGFHTSRGWVHWSDYGGRGGAELAETGTAW